MRGGGTRGCTPAGIPLSTAGLSGVVLYEPGALTLVAQAGTPLAEIDAVLAEGGQRLAFEPMDHRVMLGTTGAPTLGGAISGNISGPRRIQAGAARDFALGVRFVDGAGTVVKNGGRVMKNVTGYDLVKLMVGSWGALGVLTEVSLKVLPIAETETTLVVHTSDEATAVAAMSRALGSPFDVTGAAHDGQTLIRLEGFEQSVAYRAAELREILGAMGEVEVLEAAPSKARWAGVRDVAPFADLAAVWKVSVKPSDAPAILQELRELAGISVQMDWGGGLLWIGLSAAELQDLDAEALHGNIQAVTARFGGHATLVKVPEGARIRKRFQPQPPAIAALTEAIQAKFDPRGIFNSGLVAV